MILHTPFCVLILYNFLNCPEFFEATYLAYVLLLWIDYFLFNFVCLSFSSAVSPKLLVLKLVVFYLWQNVKCFAGLVKSISSVLCQCFLSPTFSRCLTLKSYFGIATAFPVMQGGLKCCCCHHPYEFHGVWQGGLSWRIPCH